MAAQNINLLYKDTKSNINTLSVSEGFIAYANDTNEIGYYNGSSWVWTQFISGETMSPFLLMGG